MSVRKRSFGKTSKDIILPATAFINGFNKANIICITKHFPGYDAAENSDHNIAISDADSISVAKHVEAFIGTIENVSGIIMSSILFNKFTDLNKIVLTFHLLLVNKIFMDGLIYNKTTLKGNNCESRNRCTSISKGSVSDM